MKKEIGSSLELSSYGLVCQLFSYVATTQEPISRSRVSRHEPGCVRAVCWMAWLD